MKFLRYVLLAAVSVLPATTRAETDYIALPKITSIQNGYDDANQIEDLRVHDDAVILDDTIVGGDLTVSGTVAQITTPAITVGDVGVSTNLDFGLQTITLTNGGFITLRNSWVELNNTGTASVTTTNPLVAAFAPALVGRLILLQAAAANTDSIHIAESATFVAAATNLTLTAEDSVILQIVATNKVRQITGLSVN